MVLECQQLLTGQAMGRTPETRSSSTPRPHGHGYDALIDIMAEMRMQGVEIAPVVHSLLLQLYDTANAAQEHSERLASKHAHLQAEHGQLVDEFNKYCKDVGEGWKRKARRLLHDDLCRFVDSANASSQASRNSMKSMFTEHMAMTLEVAALRTEVAALKKENMELRAQNAMAKSPAGSD
ncbi:hypothetical protein F5Y05DRAFT_59325 [Hypoxylon sp. FL0543]|nr:hypothetical protein F5Y05DRAFT_59325 [Hypoxylon sp. FL0543]